MIFNVIKLKLNDINLSIYTGYAVEIVFETIFHANGRNMTYEKEFHYFHYYCVVSLSKNINPSSVLVQHRKTTERLLVGRKESNQTKTS